MIMTLRQTSKPGVSRRAAVRTAGLAALSAGLGVAATSRVADAQSSPSGIVGTWRVRIPSILVNRTEDIQLLLIFIPGGVFLSPDSPVEPAADPTAPRDSVDYQGMYAGQWLQLPSGEVRATALQLDYDRRAVVTSEEVVDYAISYDGNADTIAGTWEWRETASDGRLLFSSTGPLAGTRVKVGS
jgi:hypothetical protein